MNEIERKDRAYLFFFVVGACVLFLTLFETNQGVEALDMLLGLAWPISAAIIVSLILTSAAATMYSFVTKPKDWALLVLAVITIPYEVFALDNLSFLSAPVRCQQCRGSEDIYRLFHRGY